MGKFESRSDLTDAEARGRMNTDAQRVVFLLVSTTHCSSISKIQFLSFAANVYQVWRMLNAWLREDSTDCAVCDFTFKGEKLFHDCEILFLR